MGTHHTSPSRLLDSPSQEKLSEYLAAHPELIGASVTERFRSEGAAEGNLPFLFKILAIGKALSIQTHPDKEMARKLHAERPDVYKGTLTSALFPVCSARIYPYLHLRTPQMRTTNPKWRSP